MRQTPKQVIEQIRAQKDSHEVIPTGFVKLDAFLDGGFFLKELVVVGAHTGIGKSQIAGQILLTAASDGFKCAYFSLEISNEMVLSRMIGAIANIKPTQIRFGNLTPEEYSQRLEIESEVVSLGELLSLYDDCYELDNLVQEIKQNKYDLVIIDFIQNIMDKVTDEYSRMTKVALTLQKLAKETGSCIVVLSQLSNTAAKDGIRSKTIEYKGSGGIAMVADLGIILERPQNENYTQSDGIELTIKKNRRGLSGVTFRLGYSLPGGLLYEK